MTIKETELTHSLMQLAFAVSVGELIITSGSLKGVTEPNSLDPD
jgi:hypothetical protein